MSETDPDPVPASATEVRPRPRIGRFWWTDHALRRAAEYGLAPEAVSRWIGLATPYYDPHGGRGVCLRCIDARAIHVHPELERSFGQWVVVRRRVVLTVVEPFRDGESGLPFPYRKINRLCRRFVPPGVPARDGLTEKATKSGKKDG